MADGHRTVENLPTVLARLESDIDRLASHDGYAEVVDEVRGLLREIRTELGIATHP